MSIDKVLIKTTKINASTKKVWDALTNPDLIKQWLFGTNVITDWKGTEYKDKGTILQFEREKIFQYNYWSGFSGLPDNIENYSIITFEILPTSNGTQLTLTHSNFPAEIGYEHSDKNWDTTLDLL